MNTRHSDPNNPLRPARERGAALVVGLILLLVMTLLGISGITASTLDLTMAGNAQYAQDAFQAAESAIEAELALGPATPDVPRVTAAYQFGPSVTASTTTTFQATRLPPPGYSLTEYQSDHYMINSLGASGRGSTSNHLQGFFVVIPSLGGGS